ncbi:T9SS type A sorting domain-containing protein [Acidiluteibacter ferrifornacis]|uniref:T9SS type A sorting domain-containing protein n=1 Tax=Acidiluteibacter ferrifornacis TaxID=2692424 RepID=UPI00293B8DAB|nr:T9SS type A sorting domain-containing protein [Acidiluteibacter ferrifornacis]
MPGPPFSGSFAVQIIKNGCIDTTACVTVTGVGLHEDGFKSNFYISNNPTKNVFNLYNNNNITVATSLMSLNGKVMEVPQKSTASAIQFDLSELPTGVYILNIQDQEGSMAHFKIVKQ